MAKTMTWTEQGRLLKELGKIAGKNNRIDPSLHAKYETKRGLRNADGTGVLVGLTEIGNVHGYVVDEKEKVPVDGKLTYRGIPIRDITRGIQGEKRFGFEEVAYLLLFGDLPKRDQLDAFCTLLDASRELDPGFTEDMILKAPSNDIMNKLARSVLVCYSYDDNPDDRSVPNVLRQCIRLIASFSTMVAYGYQAKSHFHDGKSLFIHKPLRGKNTAESFLHMIRPDSKYTPLEAEMLDLMLMLHAEHGGGNNSAFTTHVVASSGTDVYSVIAAAVGSLKGPLHGGANKMVLDMMDDIKANVPRWEDEKALSAHLTKILKKEAFDRTGLIYGQGHAVYTLSDPRAVLLKEKAGNLAKEKGEEHVKTLELYRKVEGLAPKLFREVKGSDKPISANVDFYSGFVYRMLGIPRELYTPLFAIARIAGWSSHVLEETVSGGRIIRPAYKSVALKKEYVPLKER